uniref:Uncharacterized protein n=1 Tax=Arundo donax TaxID=35708 RepID=A0A0A8Z3D8_ARUDO
MTTVISLPTPPLMIILG